MKADRERRLVEALRQNLKRRKVQGRERANAATVAEGRVVPTAPGQRDGH